MHFHGLPTVVEDASWLLNLAQYVTVWPKNFGEWADAARAPSALEGLGWRLLFRHHFWEFALGGHWHQRETLGANLNPIPSPPPISPEGPQLNKELWVSLYMLEFFCYLVLLREKQKEKQNLTNPTTFKQKHSALHIGYSCQWPASETLCTFQCFRNSWMSSSVRQPFPNGSKKGQLGCGPVIRLSINYSNWQLISRQNENKEHRSW